MANYRQLTCFFMVCIGWVTFSMQSEGENSSQVFIEAGTYTPLFKSPDEQDDISVDAFYLDRYQVTNQQFAQFTQHFSKWRT